VIADVADEGLNIRLTNKNPDVIFISMTRCVTLRTGKLFMTLGGSTYTHW